MKKTGRYRFQVLFISVLMIGAASLLRAQSIPKVQPSDSARSCDLSSALAFDLRMSDCENRWVVLPKKPGDDSHAYGYIYIDPTAGFTLYVGGGFKLDAAGKYQSMPNPLMPRSFTLIDKEGKKQEYPTNAVQMRMRLRENGIVSALPRDALAQLGLSDTPEWISHYEDKSSSAVHAVNWGRLYNGFGDSARALSYLEPVFREQPQARGLIFELAYAYNALGRFGDAVALVTSISEQDRKNPNLCKELAFSYLSTKRFREAKEWYLYCLSIEQSTVLVRSEMAFNLSQAYRQLGDGENCKQWMSKAREWAPQGSHLDRRLKQQPQMEQACGS